MGSFGKKHFCNGLPLPGKTALAGFSKNSCQKSNSFLTGFPACPTGRLTRFQNFNPGLTGV
jgi:hypothetical protein